MSAPAQYQDDEGVWRYHDGSADYHDDRPVTSEPQSWAESLSNEELAKELVDRALDPDEYDHWVIVEVAREAARRLRRMAEPPF